MRTPTKKPRFSLEVSLLLPVLATVLLLPAAPAFAAGACPNEQFRVEDNSTSLPDCRAYEQVSPVSKEGNEFKVYFITEDGESVAMQSYAGSSGAPARYTISNGYLAQRTGAGWDTTSLDPSPSELHPSGASELDSTPNLLGQVWLAGGGPELEGFELFVRQPDGTWAGTKNDLAGPQGTNPPLYLGGSSNLSDLLFRAGDGVSLSPEDKVAADNLYEMIGAGSGSPVVSFVPVEDSGKALSATAAATLGSGVSGSEWHAVSRNGSKVFFDIAPGASYGNGDTNTQVFARINNTETVDLSEPTATECSACVETSPKADAYAGASEEGEKVFFTTEQGLQAGQTAGSILAPDLNLYEYDFQEPVGHRIVLVSAGSTKPEVQGVIRISNDGSHVYFVAKGKLTSQQNKEGEEAHAGADNMYVFEQDEAHPTGQVTFIADLCSAAGKSGTVTDTRCPAASTFDSALWSTKDARPAQTTPTGGYLVFESVADLTAGDTSTVAQVFRYDAETGELIRISAGEDGYDDNGNTMTNPASINSPSETSSVGGGATADLENSYIYKRAISSDGSYVVFSTTAALSERDTNGAEDVYEWHNGSVSLISDGTDPTGSKFENMSSSGSNIFFSTGDSLVGQDTDTGEDIYDAKIEGGFAAPTPPSPGCSGEACQPLGALYTPPGPAGSSTQPAGENLAPTAATTTTTTTTTTKTTKPKALTKAQKLSKALKACKKEAKGKQAKCEKAARKKFGAVKSRKKKTTTTKR